MAEGERTEGERPEGERPEGERTEGERPEGERTEGERELRALLHAEPGLTVLTGGQTGVDSYAARAALDAGLTVHLVFPLGWRQEDGPLTAARRAWLAGAVLHELPSASFRYRTWTCAYLGDAVLLIDPAGGAGCRETARAAHQLGRPLLEPEPAAQTAAQPVTWLGQTGTRVLMVAGCRATVLARKGEGRGIRTQLAAIMAGARDYHGRLLASGRPGS